MIFKRIIFLFCIINVFLLKCSLFAQDFLYQYSNIDSVRIREVIVKQSEEIFASVHNNYSGLTQDWIKYYGFGQNPHAPYCIENYDKGYIISGSINNYKYGWIVKTDINGNQLWDIKIGDGVHDMRPSNIEQTSDNGFVLAGTTAIYSPPSTDPIIIKLNSCGEPEWCKVLDYDNEPNGAVSVKQTDDGGYVLLSMFYGNLPDDFIRSFKFDDSGELLWYKIYNRDSLIYSESAQSFFVDQTNFLITGSCYYPNWRKPYFIQTDTAGNETWRLVYSQHTGLGFIGEAWSTIRDINGNYYSAGRRVNSPELIKVSSQGFEMMAVDLFPTAESGSSRIILMLNDTTCIIDAGWSYDGNINYYAILKIDTLGSIKKIKYLPDPNNSGSSWATKTFDNKVLLTGMNFIGANSRIVLSKFNSTLEYDSVYTSQFRYDSLCPDTIVSHTINPACDVLVGLQDPIKNPESTILKIYPNPANQDITVEFPKYLVVKTNQQPFSSTTVYHKWKSTMFEVYNFSGKRVFEKEIVCAQPSLKIPVSQWQKGIYYFRLMYNNQTVAGRKVVVE